MIVSDSFCRQLERHEGFFARPYLCPAGKATIGFGTNLEAHPQYVPEGICQQGLHGQTLVDALKSYGLHWSEKSARAAMRQELDDCHANLMRRCPAYAALRGDDNDTASVRADVLLNMAFNIGISGLLGFKKMFAAVERGDFAAAADEMRCSAWYGQVKTRAVELCEQMRTGVYSGAYRAR